MSRTPGRSLLRQNPEMFLATTEPRDASYCVPRPAALIGDATQPRYLIAAAILLTAGIFTATVVSGFTKEVNVEKK